MDFPTYFLDITVLATAAACFISVFCGWHLRATAARTLAPARPTPTAASGFLEVRTPLRTTLCLDSGITTQEVLDATSVLSEVVRRLQEEELAGLHGVGGDELPTSEMIRYALGQFAMHKDMLEAQIRAAEIRIDEKERQLETVELNALTDALTSVGNRRALDDALGRWKGTTPGAVAIIDIDDFKHLNDEHGRLTGDEVLRQIASLLSTKFEGKGSVSRYAGGVFAVVLDSCSIEQANESLEATRKLIANQTIEHAKKSIQVTCSIGTTRLTVGEPMNEWLQRADDALYMSRFAGKNCGHCIDCHVIGKREKPYRLGSVVGENPVKAVSNGNQNSSAVEPKKEPKRKSIFETLPNSQLLGENYKDVLCRIGQVDLNFSVLTITLLENDEIAAESTKLPRKECIEQLCEVAKSFVRICDRIGYLDESTLLICMPGLGPEKMNERCRTLLGLAVQRLQISPSEFEVNSASAKSGDTFETIVQRACLGNLAAV